MALICIFLCLFAFPGSGKTFSMFGTEIPDNVSVLNATRQEAKGIVPRACEEIFAALERRRWLNGIESEVSVSYVEVFGDEVSDLLKRGARCGQSKVAAQQFVLSGAAERVIYSMQDVEEVLRIGKPFCTCLLVFEALINCD